MEKTFYVRGKSRPTEMLVSTSDPLNIYDIAILQHHTREEADAAKEWAGRADVGDCFDNDRIYIEREA